MSNRREFLITMGQAAAVAALSPTVFAEAQEQFPADIATLYRKSVVIDTLCGPFTNDDEKKNEAALDAVRKSGITAINYTISQRTFDDTIQNLGYVQSLVDRWPDVFTIVRKQ